jgi:dihydrofolate reductase
VTDGIESALRQAQAVTGDRDVKIGGGVSTVRQYLVAGAIDTLHLAVSPTVLGQGKRVFDGIDFRALGYRVTEYVPTEKATHIVLSR